MSNKFNFWSAHGIMNTSGLLHSKNRFHFLINFDLSMLTLPVRQIFSSADNFANCLDPDQDRQNVGPDLDPNCLTL